MLWKAQAQRHEVGIYDEEVSEVFLYCADDFVVIGFGEPLKRRLLNDVTEVCSQSVFQIDRYSLCANLHMWYSPYLGSRNSSIKLCIDSGDGLTKHRQRRWRIFSLVWLSTRLFAAGQHMREGTVAGFVLGEVDLMVQEGGLSRRG